LNTKDYITLLNKPHSLNEKQLLELDNILSEFPYLQSARAIYLKGLYNQDSFRYNTELKKTAAFTTDRSVLFDFITSENFQSIEKEHFEEVEKLILDFPVNNDEVVETVITQSIEEADRNATTTEPTEEKENIPKSGSDNSNIESEKLEIGKPIPFTPSETHSFSEWLQLSKLSPIVREEETEEPKQEEASLDKKLDLIDKFIEANPKITPVKNITPPPSNIKKNSGNNSSLMTETLARVYLEQKKYTKAIQAYEILILKYPEKSVFFADRISDIKTLQQNNN